MHAGFIDQESEMTRELQKKNGSCLLTCSFCHEIFGGLVGHDAYMGFSCGYHKNLRFRHTEDWGREFQRGKPCCRKL